MFLLWVCILAWPLKPVNFLDQVHCCRHCFNNEILCVCRVQLLKTMLVMCSFFASSFHLVLCAVFVRSFLQDVFFLFRVYSLARTHAAKVCCFVCTILVLELSLSFPQYKYRKIRSKELFAYWMPSAIKTNRKVLLAAKLFVCCLLCLLYAKEWKKHASFSL